MTPASVAVTLLAAIGDMDCANCVFDGLLMGMYMGIESVQFVKRIVHVEFPLLMTDTAVVFTPPGRLP